MGLIRDWWRGYSEVDVVSLTNKIQGGKPGESLLMTPGETRALRAGRVPLPKGAYLTQELGYPAAEQVADATVRAYEVWCGQQVCHKCGARYADRQRGPDGRFLTWWDAEDDCGCKEAAC
jgi:hypothetical protein